MVVASSRVAVRGAGLRAVAAATDVAPPELCGSWSVACAQLPSGQYASALWTFAGISIGGYTYSGSVYTDPACKAGQTLQVEHAGEFKDMGPAQAAGARQLMLVPSDGFHVTPMNAATTTQLQVRCAAGRGAGRREGLLPHERNGGAGLTGGADRLPVQGHVADEHGAPAHAVQRGVVPVDGVPGQ